jgi:hypothetical protein
VEKKIEKRDQKLGVKRYDESWLSFHGRKVDNIKAEVDSLLGHTIRVDWPGA